VRRFTPLLFFVSVAAIVTWPLVANLTSRLAAEYGPGDPFLNLWILAWDLKTISVHPGWLVTGRVFDANIFYPSIGTLAYSDHQLVQALAVWPLYVATGNLTLCYNAVFLVSLILSAWAMFGFIRSVTGSAVAAYCAGLIWGFCPFHFAHLIHIQLQSLYWMPLTFWFVHRLVAGRRVRDSVWLGVVFALQALSSVYYGVIGAVGLIAAGAVVVTRTRGWSPRLLWRFALAAVVVVVVAGPGLWPYWRVQQREGFARTLYEAENHSATLASYLQAPPTNLVHGRTGWIHSIQEASGLPKNEGPEQGLFPGVFVLGLAVLGLVRARKAGMSLLATSMTAVGAAGFVLSFGPRGLRILYAALYEWVFGFQAIRAPARFSALVFFALAVLAGIGLASLVRRTSHEFGDTEPRVGSVGPTFRSGEPRVGSVGPTFRSGEQDVTPARVGPSLNSRVTPDSLWPAALVLLVVVVEVSNGAIRYAPAPTLTTNIGRWLRDAPESGPVVYFPIGTDRDDSAAMVAALEHGRPIVNGHSGQRPALYLTVVDQLATFPDSLALLTLREIGVRFVVAQARLPPSALPGASPLVERAAFDEGVIYELRWTPEIAAAFEEAENAGRVALLPPGPLPFQTGESSRYRVHLVGGPVTLPAGEAVISAERAIDGGLRIRVRATTAGWVRSLFEADDELSAETDAQLVPRIYRESLNEGRRRIRRTVSFDPGAKRATVTNGDTAAVTLPLSIGARDPLSALFYVRTLPLALDFHAPVLVNDAGRNTTVDVKVLGEESITIGGRSYETWKLEPTLVARLQWREPPRAIVWVSRDSRKVPLLIRVSATFGTVDVELADYRGW
jgi:Protein of unknown function (DUF3108)